MGLLDKVKGILFDEEEVEIPVIKKEEKKEETKHTVREENPIKEIKIPKDDFSDKENYKSESTFTFPVDFDDDLEKTKPIKREEPKKEYKQKQRDSSRDYTSYLRGKEEKKFKPTPIISPVYGVLDQNYKKEDVIVKKDVLRKPSELTLDEVRKRAFGSLEDELEQTLTKQPSLIKEKEVKENIIKEDVIEKPIDKRKTIGELIDEDDINIDIPSIEIEENDNTIIGNDINLSELDKDIDEITLKEEENNNEEEQEENVIISEKKDDTKEELDDDEADLFSLIDSMYEEKGE